MALNLPPLFEQDIQGRDTALVPIVVINLTGNDASWSFHQNLGVPLHLILSTGVISGNFRRSLQEHMTEFEYGWGTETWTSKPLLLNIPSLKESIDIEKRNYKISSINIDISNAIYDSKRFSELIDSSLINKTCRIFWASPSTGNISFYDLYDTDPVGNILYPSDDDAFQVYNGTIRRYTHDDEKVRLVVEDRSQATLHKDLPLEKNYLGTGEGIPDKYKGKPKPMVYGHVDRSPCVIGSADSIIEENGASFKILIDSKKISSVVHTKPLANAPDPKGFLFIYLNNHYYRVLNDNTDVYGSFGSGVQAQILDEDIQLPDINGNSSVSMVARFDHEQAMNNLAKNSILVDIGRIPNSVNPYLIKLSDTDAGGGEPSDESNLNLISGDLTNMYDMDESSLVHVVRHNVPSTNSSSDFRGMGFRFSFDSLGIDSEIIPDYLGNLTAYRIFTKFKFGCWGGELNLHWYNGTERKTFLQYNYGNSGYEEHLTIDNLFQTDSLTGYTAGTFDAGTGGIENTSDFSFSQFTWQDVNIDDPISIYQLSSLYTDDVNFDWDIYGLAVHAGFLIKEPQGRDFYANVKGRTNIGGVFIQDSPQIIMHIIAEISDISFGSILSQAMEDDIYSDYPLDSWKYGFTVHKKINSKKLIEGIASASPFIPRFDNMGNFKFDVIPATGGTVTSDDHHIKEADVIDFSFSRSKIEQVYTKIVFKYNWDYARGEFNDSVDAQVDDFDELVGYELDHYGFADHVELVVDGEQGKFIRDFQTAQKFVAWYLLWSCNQHLKMKIKLPLKYMNLEIGDIVDFDAILGGGVKPYGINYVADDDGTYSEKVNGQTIYPTFLITSTNKTLEWVEIECVQLPSMVAPEDWWCQNFEDMVSPFTCEEAVANWGCDFQWGDITIGEACPNTCGLCDDTVMAGLDINIIKIGNTSV